VRVQFEVENADEVAERRLAEAVSRHAGGRVGPRPGRHVHDGALAALAHVRLDRLAQPERRTEVDVHHDPQVLGCRGDRLAQTEGTDRVHQHLRGADLGGDLVDEALGGGRIGRVARLAADAVGQFLQPLFVAVDPDYHVPGGCQGLGGRPAEPSARADHDRYALLAHVSPSGHGWTWEPVPKPRPTGQRMVHVMTISPAFDYRREAVCLPWPPQARRRAGDRSSPDSGDLRGLGSRRVGEAARRPIRRSR